MCFYVYEDWTLEEVPRCFYVGKGSFVRIKNLHRNYVHERITRKHGLRREIVLVTSVEQLALDYEIDLISEHKTFINGGEGWWRTNFTRGGEGVNGWKHTPEVRVKMSIAKRGKPSTRIGSTHSTESKKLMSKSAKARGLSEGAKKHMFSSENMMGELNSRSKISNVQRNEIVKLHLDGLQNKFIVKQLGISAYHTVNNVLIRWRKRGKVLW
jgi:hypothetical protein